MTNRRRVFITSAGSVIVAAMITAPTPAGVARDIKGPADGATVHALFNPNDPGIGPFPTDNLTVPDHTHNTGRRVNLPYPDCTVRISDCEDLDVINTLDGFGLQPQLSIAFDGPIDPGTVDSSALFLIDLGSTIYDGRGSGRQIGINQIVWDSFTQTVYVETDELLEQHTRYALIATNRLLDATGEPVEASDAFRRFRQTVRGDYKQALLGAIQTARRLGILESDIVAASVFTTQSITSVMERIRDQIKEARPEPASFLLGPAGERAVFNRASVTSIAWTQQTGVTPLAFTTVPISLQLLQVVPGAVGTIAYGSFVSPDYLVHPGEYIPVVGTRTGTPAVQGYNRLYFTLYLPSGAAPPGGWPVAIAGHSGSGNQHQTTGILASTLASHGIATIGINNPGNGFGPLSTLTISMTDGTSLIIPDEGRGIDQNGDGIIATAEGAAAAAPRTWTIQERDSFRQLVADLMQLVRVIEVGIDVDGDGGADLDASRIYYHGPSTGGRFGTMFLALEPSVSTAVLSFAGGMTPEHDRWSPFRRTVFAAMLQNRVPSLINAPGIAAIDGVAVPPPHFNENKPARDEAAVLNTVAGAIEIQRAMELAEMGAQSGITPVVWARHLRQRPLAGMLAKSVMYQSAETDQIAVTPGTSAILRAGALADAAVHYRHDLAFAEDKTIPKNPHIVLAGVTHPNPFFRSIASGLLNQAGVFLASGGTIVIHPEPARVFEVPIRTPLPEALNFVK